MKEKIFAYLRERKQPISAEELVREVLSLRQASAEVSRRLIESLLGSDPRFQWDVERKGEVALVEVVPPDPGGYESPPVWGIVHLITPRAEAGRPVLAAVAAIRVREGRVEERLLAWTEEGRRQAAREFSLETGELTDSGSDRSGLERICRLLHGAAWVSFEPPRDLALLNGRLQVAGLPAIDPPALGLRALTKKLFPGETVRTAEAAAVCLGVPWADVSPPDLQVQHTMEIFGRVLELAEDLGLSTLDDLLTFQKRETEPIDWSRFRFDSRSLAALPKQPGIYCFIDRGGAVLYVGKAKNLNSRVQSYFQSTGTEEEKKRAIRQSAYDLTYEVMGSELEALLHEAQAIKSWRPAINTQVEIHEPESEDEPPGNRILILPSKEASSVELFLIRQDKAFEQITAAQDLSDLRAVERRIKRFLSIRKKRPPAEEAWKASLVWRWLKRNQEKVLAFDPDRAADWSECARLLKRYIQEPPGAERIIHR